VWFLQLLRSVLFLPVRDRHSLEVLQLWDAAQAVLAGREKEVAGGQD
jgi:hypothetical protein